MTSQLKQKYREFDDRVMITKRFTKRWRILLIGADWQSDSNW